LLVAIAGMIWSNDVEHFEASIYTLIWTVDYSVMGCVHRVVTAVLYISYLTALLDGSLGCRCFSLLILF
jgi:hypothetical protein